MITNLCRYQGHCSGCFWLGTEVSHQRAQKAQALLGKSFPSEIHWVDCGTAKLRDRVDLTWEEGRLGLFELDAGARRILDLEECPMLSPALVEWFKSYRSKKPPIKKGSVRLRVAPNGQKGVWLDFANVDVKALFEEKEYLRWLSEQAVVEIGQRRKRLEWVEGRPKLRDSKLEAWFETYAGDQTIPIYTTIAGFTQSGFEANRRLVNEVLTHVKASGQQQWTELFAGSGNFSLALAASGYQVTALEMEASALEGLKRSCEERNLAVEIVRRDLYRPAELSGDAWLVDPPRSGLKNLIESIAASKPQYIVYVSCWSESFSADTEKLSQLGYRVEKLSAVDQFVHTPHAEWVASFVDISRASRNHT